MNWITRRTQSISLCSCLSLMRRASSVGYPQSDLQESTTGVRRGRELDISRDVMNTVVTQLQNDIPRALPLIGVLKNAVEGRVLCKVHTDSWPSFSTIACEIMYPRISEVADLLCYSQGSGDDIINVLVNNNLITWGRRQQIYHMETEHTDHLLKHLVEPVTGRRALVSSLEAVASYLPKGIQEEISCPDGFTIGQLQPQHTSLVAKHWRKYSDWQRSLSYIEGLISDFETKAVYLNDSKDIGPVAWILQYPYGRLAGLYTLRDYRNKDFGTLLTAELCKSIAASGLMPEALTEVGNMASRKITSKLGLIESKYHLNWLVIQD